jgi:hypothetical protein
MNITVGRSITSPTFFRAQIAAFAFSKARATLHGSRPLRGDSSGGDHVLGLFCSVRAGPTIGASALCPKFVAADTAALRTPRRCAPSQPLLDLSMHRVVCAQDLLFNN